MEDWKPIGESPNLMPDVYLVVNSKGQVAPCIEGIIHNTVGPGWDWEPGARITHWRPLQNPTKYGVLPRAFLAAGNMWFFR